jgi:hypothetical protein
MHAAGDAARVPAMRSRKNRDEFINPARHGLTWLVFK